MAFDSPSERRKIFKDRINDLLTLYSSVAPPPGLMQHQYDAYLGLVRTTFFWVAEDEHFEVKLSPDAQAAAVKLVRERLFAVCALHHAHGTVPAIEPLVRPPPSLCWTELSRASSPTHRALAQAKELYGALGHDAATVRLALDPLADHLPVRPSSPTST